MPAQHGQSSKLLPNPRLPPSSAWIPTRESTLNGSLMENQNAKEQRASQAAREAETNQLFNQFLQTDGGEPFEGETFQAYFDRSVEWLKLQKTLTNEFFWEWEEQVMGYYRESPTVEKCHREELLASMEE